MRRSLSLQSLTALSIVGLMLVVAGVLLWHGARGADQLLVSAVQDTGRQLALTTEERARRLIDPARVVVQLLAQDELTSQQRLVDRLQHLPLLAASLKAHSAASAVYVGYDDGDFLLLRPADRVSSGLLPDVPGAERAAYLVQAVDRDPEGDARGEWRLYDQDLNLLVRRARPDYDFDPRRRPWYREAMAADGAQLTKPYAFFTTHEVGITLSQRSRSGQAVVGLDASLADLGDEMASLGLTPGTRLAVVGQSDRLMAYPDVERLLIAGPEGLRLATLEELDDPVLNRLGVIAETGEAARFRVNGQAWFGMRLPFQIPGEQPSHLLVAMPETELLAGTRQLLWQRTLVAGLLVLALLPLGVWVGHRLGQPLYALAEQVQALAAFDFSACRGVRSPVREVQRLSRALEGMAGSIADFQRMTRTLNSEARLETMLANILEDLLSITDSRHGAIYLEDEADATRFACLAEKGQGELGEPLPPRLTLTAPDDDGLATLSRKLEARGYLVQPLSNRSGHRMGLLLLALREAGPGEDRPWRRFVEEISGAAAVAIETRRLLEGEQRLLDAIVELIAGATDAKSPHTGGHCSRVPQLAEMLLEGAHRMTSGPFALEVVDDNRRTAFHLAAWLHDCGKLTTPDEVMEKATRLETRYNRIHEIRTRFEVLWRDADIAYWRGRAEGGDEAVLAQARERRRTELQEAWQLVAELNLGSERGDETRSRRLEEIAEWRWWRHFDDRLGISEDEAERLAREPTVELPAEEPLLADRPRHRIDWVASPPPVAPEDPANRWGFAMRPPAVAGNQGELYNLKVARGTLNDVERFRIQEHIVQTIIMLESLPWPGHLRRVPAIAGNHHERMDGRGYPRRLRLADASLEERIMAVADVFEALTAADRPYKPGMTLSRSLTILAGMARDGHLDPDVFALLLDSGVWREYATRFLAPEQIDSVDIAALKAAAGR
ncbi:HD domain-containing phosphohydrolase [Halomonas organivorans]|uniref:HD-GYP domain-containing protein (C-di-GMP phosphodiesterase class II) n=1 Tax=Halomonas organivorans TaxID=257772 RepID=A0A7W5BWN8_9GAMM|nr:HD domain-containing phosphohydrolase [Halomonas organivorans]MBB3140461.1 HD-GYP domain-containing protein (c-di-GMP phosphodiesterase class II) [Halomonas organivorans]